MQANRKRNIKSGQEYTHLFPKAVNSTSTIRRNANVDHTVAFIPKVVNETLYHTKALAQKLKGKTNYETCSNIWHFVYQHIAYKKDQEGYEQIRSPARAWHDRQTGVDCDCYSVFISSILTNLSVPHILRITKYHRDYFQHIYPVVVASPPTPLQKRGEEIVIDCVTDSFNYEVPYSEKKDYPMDLQYLNGFDGFGELGKVKKGGAKKAASQKKPSLLTKLKAKKTAKSKTSADGSKPKKKGFFKKVLNTVNRVNPATVLLRNGVLAVMKLNVKNVAGRLRWSYLTPEQAAQKNIDPQKFQRLVAAREKLEKIFYGAGGNPKNLRKAMINGKGNKDKAVAGLDGISFAGVEYMSAYTPLPQLLGREMYYSENIEGFEGLGELGEPITLATVGAAMGVISGVVAALKQIGNIFNGSGEGSRDFDEQTNEAAENNAPLPNTTSVPLPDGGASLPAPLEKQAIEEGFKKESGGITNDSLIKTGSDDYSGESSSLVPTGDDGSNMSITKIETLLPTTTTTSSVAKTSASDAVPKEGFWEKNKTWLKPLRLVWVELVS
jgi:hypothetical protein